MASKTFTSLGNLVKLLPSGTYFLFVFLSPVATNNGQCNAIHKYLTSILIGICGFVCCLSWFTDTYTDDHGGTQYGIVTKNGLFSLSDSKSIKSSRYKLRLGDFVHAFVSGFVFAIVALLDPNTVRCLYPSFESAQQVLLMVLPPLVGAASSFVFVIFPNKRHGIGYSSSQESKESQDS